MRHKALWLSTVTGCSALKCELARLASSSSITQVSMKDQVMVTSGSLSWRDTKAKPRGSFILPLKHMKAAASWQPGKLKKAAFVPLFSNVAWTEPLPPSAAHKLMQCGKHCCRWLSDRLLLLFLGVDQTSHL